MTNAALSQRVSELRGRLADVRAELRAAMAESAALDVHDYAFSTPLGEVKLSALFGRHRDLFVVHSMGVACTSCTLWADGFNGVYAHLADRAGFALSSPDLPEKQAAFAADRGWRFPMVGHAGTTFAADMGFVDEKGRCLPGVSAFRREGEAIRRVSASRFEPHDDYCTLWHLLDLLPEGAEGWRPRHSYG
jgi:predicted dithiol-disulfide oxidoreductase (DUF899 family)